MANNPLSSIIMNRLSKKAARTKAKVNSTAIPTVEDPTLQTWIKSIDTTIKSAVKNAVTRSDLINTGLVNSNLESLVPKNEPDDLTVPRAILNLRAAGAYSSVTITWDTPNSRNFGLNAVYRAETDDFGQAVQIGSSLGDVYTDYIGNDAKVYYWVRTISRYGVEGELSPSVYAETSIDIDYYLEQLTDKINNSHLTQALKEKIKNIDINADAIFQETKDRIQAVFDQNQAWRKAINDTVADYIQRFKETKVEWQESIDSEAQARQDALIYESTLRAKDIANEAEQRQQSIIEEAFARKQGDKATDYKIDQLTSRFESNDTQVRGLILSESETRSNENGVISKKLDGVFAQVNPIMAGDGNNAGDEGQLAGVWTETSARIEGDLILSERIENVQAVSNQQNSSLTALIQKEQTARIESDQATARQVNTLYANVEEEKRSIQALITTEQQVRSSQVEALSREITMISAGVGEQFDTKLISFFDDGTDGWTCEKGQPFVEKGYIRAAFSDTSNALISPFESETINGAVYPHLRMRIMKFGDPIWSGSIAYGDQFGLTCDVEEPVWDIHNIGIVQLDTGWSGSIHQIKVLLANSQDQSNHYMIDWIAIGRPSPAASYSALSEEQQARASADRVLAESIRTISGTINNNDTQVRGLISEEQRVRAEKDTVLVQQIEQMTAEHRNNNTQVRGLITDESIARADENQAMVRRIEALTAEYSQNDTQVRALITEEAKTRANENEVLATKFDGVFAQINPDMAGDEEALAGNETKLVGVWTETSARIEGDLLEAQKREVLQAENSTEQQKLQASILNEQKTRINGDQVLAEQVALLSAETNNELSKSNAAILKEQQARTDQEQALTRQIETLSAEYSQNDTQVRALITEEAKTRANENEVLATKFDGVFAQINPDMAGDEEALAGNETKLVGVWTETSARIEGDLLEAQKREVLQAENSTEQQKIRALITTETKARIDENSALASRLTNFYTEYDGNYSAMQQSVTSLTTTTNSLIESITTFESSLDGNNTKLQQTMNAVDGLKAEWRIKVDQNGAVSGLIFGLDGEESAFTILANRMTVLSPNGEISIPFNIDPDGKTYINTALFKKASIQSAQIEDVAADKITSGDIATDRMKANIVQAVNVSATNLESLNLKVKRGDIEDLAVNTLQIADNAVTVPVAVTTTGSISVNADYTSIQTLNVPSDMGHTLLTFGAVFSFDDYSSAQQIYCRILKNNEPILSDVEVHFVEHNSIGSTSKTSGNHFHLATTSATVSISDGGSHNHSFSGSSGTAGSHSHSLNGSTGTSNSHSHSNSGSTSSENAHSHSVSGAVGNGGSHNHPASANVSVNLGYGGEHSHEVNIRGSSRSAGTISLVRHDSSFVKGDFTIQLRAVQGGTISVSQRYIHAMTLRK